MTTPVLELQAEPSRPCSTRPQPKAELEEAASRLDQVLPVGTKHDQLRRSYYDTGQIGLLLDLEIASARTMRLARRRERQIYEEF